MSKSKMLSPREQEIYFALSNPKNRLFTIDVLKGLGFGSYGALRLLLSDMAKKGWLTRIKRGTYYLNATRMGTVDDIFKMATYVYNGYLAFSSALYAYSLIPERPYTAFVATRNESKSRMLGNIEIKAVALGDRAVGATMHEGYNISTRAKTAYDCFHMPDYAGGYSKTLEAVHNMRLTMPEWKEFLMYVNRFESDSAKRKMGYLLELLNKVQEDVPKSVLRALQAPGKVAKLGSGRNGKYVKEWQIVDYLGEGYLLGWSK